MRSYFAFVPGPKPPQQLTAVTTPAVLLTQPDLWNAAKVAAPSLIFRVRSEKGAATTFDSDDKLESCVGLVDDVVRWRVAFGTIRVALAAIKHPQLLMVCQNAAAMVTSQHPAAIPAAARDAVMRDVLRLIEDPPQDIKKVHPVEAALAIGVAQLAQCESGFEAAQLVPLYPALSPFEEGTQEQADRYATLDVISSSTLLAEACARLAERMPSWLFTRMPTIGEAQELPRPGRVADDED